MTVVAESGLPVGSYQLWHGYDDRIGQDGDAKRAALEVSDTDGGKDQLASLAGWKDEGGVYIT